MNLNDMSVTELRDLIKNARKCLAVARLDEKSDLAAQREAKAAARIEKRTAREAAKAERARMKEIRVAERKAKAEARLKATEERLEKARQKVLSLAAGKVGIKAKSEARKPGKVTVVKG